MMYKIRHVRFPVKSCFPVWFPHHEARDTQQLFLFISASRPSHPLFPMPEPQLQPLTLIMLLT